MLVQSLSFVQPASPPWVIPSSEMEESGVKKRPGMSHIKFPFNSYFKVTVLLFSTGACVRSEQGSEKASFLISCNGFHQKYVFL